MAEEAPPPPTPSMGEQFGPRPPQGAGNPPRRKLYLATPHAARRLVPSGGYHGRHLPTTPSAMEIDTPASRKSSYNVQRGRPRPPKVPTELDDFRRIKMAQQERPDALETPKLLEVVIERLGGLRVRTISAKVAAMPLFSSRYHQSPEEQAKSMKRRKAKGEKKKKAKGKADGEDVEMDDPDA